MADVVMLPGPMTIPVRMMPGPTFLMISPNESFLTAAWIRNLCEQEKGYTAITVNTGNDKLIEKESLNRLRNGFVDGMIIAGTGMNNRIIRDIAMEMPVVQVIRRLDLKMSSVAADYTDIIYESVVYLYKNGCRKIGPINGSDKISPYADRYRGKELSKNFIFPRSQQSGIPGFAASILYRKADR